MGQIYKSVTFFAIVCIVGFLFCNFVNAKTEEKKRKDVEIEIVKKVECNVEEQATLQRVVRFHYKMSALGHPDVTESTYESADAEQNGVVYLLQEGMIMKGFLSGLPGMCVGEIRRLTIPPHLAFGSKGTEVVPGGATLVYEVELLDVRPADDIMRRFNQADLNGDGLLDIGELDEIMKVAMEKGVFPIPNNPTMRETILNQLFVYADKNKDGGMSIDEFRSLLKLQQNLSEKAPKANNMAGKTKQEL